MIIPPKPFIAFTLVALGALSVAATLSSPSSFPSGTDFCAHSTDTAALRSRYSALACWLQKLKLPIPDQTFHEGIFSLTLKDFVCSNFSIAGLDSSYRPSSTASVAERNGDESSTDPELDISLQNVSAICYGTYHSRPWSGNVMAVVGPGHSNVPALQFSWCVTSALKNHSFPQPDKIHTTDCEAEIAVTDLHFSGSMSAKTIQIFVKQIRSSVTKALSTQLCPLVSSTLEPTFDHYIDMFNNWIEPYLSDEKEAPGQNASLNQVDVSSLKSRIFQWTRSLGTEHTAEDQLNTVHRHHSPKKEAVKWSRDAPALVGSLSVLNRGLQYFLKKGILQNWLPIFDDDDRPRSCGFFFDGINSLIRSVLYDSQGWMDLPLLTRWEYLHFVIPHYAAIRLKVKNVSVFGLDHFDNLQLFEPGDDESFVTRLDSHNVTFRARLHLVLSAVPDGVFKGDDLEEDFVVDLNATKMDTILRFYLTGDKRSLHDKVTVGTVWDVLDGVISRNSTLPQLPCLLESIDSFSLSDLSAFWRLASLSFVPDFNGKVGTDSLEADLDRLLNLALQVVWSEFPVMATQSIKGLAQGPVLESLNEFFERITTTNNTCIAPNHQNYYPHPIDFSNVGWLRQMNDFFRRPSTRRHVDAYLQCGADYLSEALQERVPMSPARVKSLSFENLGHLQDLKFLSPLSDGRTLRNGFYFGTNDTSLLPSLSIEMDAVLPQGSAALNLTLRWNDIGGSSGLTLDYDLGRLKQYPLTQVMEHGECMLVPTNELHMYDVASQLGSFSVDLEAAVDYGGEDTVYLNWTSADTPEVNAVASAFWTWAVNNTRDMMSLGTAAAMSKANNLCKGKKPSYDDEGNAEDYLSISLVVCAIILLAQPAVLMIHSENNEVSDLRRRLEEQEHYEDALMQPLLRDADLLAPGPYTGGSSPKRSLIEHENVPDAVRVVVPVLIICAIVLLVCSNLAIGADVELEATVGGQIFYFPSLFSFSLYNTANQMLHARIYSLLFLVAIFSGVWPYLKLCLMLFGWLKRFSQRGADRRGRMFLALDALGKFSLVDTYVLVLMVVAFRYHLEMEGGVKLDVFVAPQFGFYGFLVATILSLVLSHVLVFFHRSAEVVLPPDSCEKSAPLYRHPFETVAGRRQVSYTTKSLGMIYFVCTVVLLVVGMFQKSFIFEFGGVAGDLIGQRKDAAYSLVSLGKALPDSVERTSGVAIVGLQAAYFFFAAAAPLACLLFLLILFVCPLTLRRQFALLTCAEIANAWSAIEVFCLSIVAALLEISTFASFIVGDKCDLVDSILQRGFEDVADTCYSVSASVSWNAAYLFFGVVLNSFLVSVALRFAHTAMDERIARGSIQADFDDTLAALERSFVETISRWKSMEWVFGASATVDESQPTESRSNSGDAQSSHQEGPDRIDVDISR